MKKFTLPMISVQSVVFPVTSLGCGRRIGIWMQGCSIRCAGCISPDTWRRDETKDLDVTVLVEGLGEWIEACDGVTVSGGEPFDQPDALRALLGHLRGVVAGDLLVYSGYPAARLFARHPWITEEIDVLVSEPYDEMVPQAPPLRGSSNQQVHLLSDLARERYAADASSAQDVARSVDVAFDGREFMAIGIPQPELRRRLGERLRAAGYTLGPTLEN